MNTNASDADKHNSSEAKISKNLNVKNVSSALVVTFVGFMLLKIAFLFNCIVTSLIRIPLVGFYGQI